MLFGSGGGLGLGSIFVSVLELIFEMLLIIVAEILKDLLEELFTHIFSAIFEVLFIAIGTIIDLYLAPVFEMMLEWFVSTTFFKLMDRFIFRPIYLAIRWFIL